MKLLRQTIRKIIQEEYKVRGYIKPSSAFHTLQEWEVIVELLLDYQSKNIDTRGNKLPIDIQPIIDEYFGYLLYTDAERYELLTRRNVLNFVEDFINHRFWSFRKQYGSYFPDIDSLKFAYFYSRGDIEPYVLLDENWSVQFYGSAENIRTVRHFTSEPGLQNIKSAIAGGNPFDISCFTMLPANKEFFDPNSNILITLDGNVRAGFRSDIKSFAVDNGRRACNLYRLDYPGDDLTNICFELDSCDLTNRTSIWNEYIVTPLSIKTVEAL